MPYYQEWFVNDMRLSADRGVTRPVVTDQVISTSFRTRPHPAAVSRRELTELSVDPYAYFLTATDRRRYHEALAARGMRAQGRPDMGHPFESLRHTITGHPATINVGGAMLWTDCVATGSYESDMTNVHNGSFTTIPSLEKGSLETFAQQAYSRVAPTAVVFDASRFLGELREGLPRLGLSLLKDRAEFFKNLGGDYLNVTFGWIPFLGDLKNAATALYKATEQLAFNGKRVHRTYGRPPEVINGVLNGPRNVTFLNGTSVPAGFLPSGFPVPAKIRDRPTPFAQGSASGLFNQTVFTKSYRRERWFEGEFTSFYPLNFDPTNYFSRLNVLVNTQWTPSTLWELAPWSWLVDWELRIGDSIRANEIRANDLLVMHYGYAMEKTTYNAGFLARSPSYNFGTTGPKEVGGLATTVLKRRIRANPYGFRVGGTSGLSPSQLAILAALGLTKSR